MAESYCLKSCTECGREGCSGCRAGAFDGQCEIVKCCKEKNHESCESCTRGIYCPTRTSRDQMPEKVFAMQRRQAELAVKYRGDAAVLAKWVAVIFWSMIAMNVVDLVGLLAAFVGAIRWVNLAGTVAALVVFFWGYYNLRRVDDRFGSIAALQLATYGISTLLEVFVPGESALKTIVQLGCGIVSIVLWKTKSETFRDALSGISRELSEKWENQWKLYKLSLWLTFGGLLVCIIPVIGLVGLLAVLVGVGVLLFVTIREYVYLWQTAKTCDFFANR
mgnify:CR=1 FL=1